MRLVRPLKIMQFILLVMLFILLFPATGSGRGRQNVKSTDAKTYVKYHISDVPIQTADNTSGKVGVVLIYDIGSKKPENIPPLESGIREKLSNFIGRLKTFSVIKRDWAHLSSKIYTKLLKSEEKNSRPIKIRAVVIRTNNAPPDKANKVNL